MQSSYDLWRGLKKMGYLRTQRDPLWWPNSGTFEVVIGAILTQQTKWEKVELSLQQLKAHGLCSPEALCCCDLEHLSLLIKPSGFYNTKALRLQRFCKNLLKDFGSFESFKENADREWLLAQQGIGMESADSILCYACEREVFVVDSYTQRLLDALGYTFEDYMQLQEWMQEGIEAHFDKITQCYAAPVTLQAVFARFHGKIVEFAKEHIRGKNVAVDALETYMSEKE